MTVNEHRLKLSTIPQNIHDQTVIQREILMKSVLKGKELFLKLSKNNTNNSQYLYFYSLIDPDICMSQISVLD